MAGYATGTANNTTEEEEEENAEGNRNQPARNPVGGSHGWAKESTARARSERAGTWPGMKQGWQMSPRRMKKNNMRQEIVSSRKGTLSGEVTAGEMKMRRRRPQSSWGLPEERQEDLQNRQLR